MKTVHGNMVVIDGMGTLICGDAKLGKSEATLALLNRGHQLVSDDAIELHCKDNTLIGKCPPLMKGFLQVDYIGVINVEKLLGSSMLLDEYRVDLCIRLQKDDKIQTLTQPLSPITSSHQWLGIEIPEFQLPIGTGQYLPLLIETLATNYKLKKFGYDSYLDFVARMSLCSDDK